MTDRNTIYALTKYDSRGASSRVRFLALLPHLRNRGWNIQAVPLLSGRILDQYYKNGRHSQALLINSYIRNMFRLRSLPQPSLWWVEKEVLFGMPGRIERLVRRVLDRAVIDYDDAVHLNYLGVDGAPKPTYAKFSDYAKNAQWITVGSEALRRSMADWGASRLTKIPSTVDVAKYPIHRHREGPVVIGWIGTPITVRFLEGIRGVLVELSKRVDFTLHVVGAKWECPGVSVRCFQWQANVEAALVSDFDVGIMPLVDGSWERAKCAYKLIQYMAAGVVPVGSDVGENAEVVSDGESGFVAKSDAQWLQRLEMLSRNPSLRERLGGRARAKAEAKYDVACAVDAIDRVFFDSVSRVVRR